MEKQIEEKELILSRSLRRCYEDGLNGAAGYPLDAAEILAEHTKNGGECSGFVRAFATLFVSAMNAEYERGRGDAVK